jgi:hypothetical protein
MCEGHNRVSLLEEVSPIKDQEAKNEMIKKKTKYAQPSEDRLQTISATWFQGYGCKKH